MLPYNLMSEIKVRRQTMEEQIGSKKTSTLTWVVVGILTAGAGALIFWLVFMMLFRKGF